jgi:hypothetical protein
MFLQFGFVIFWQKDFGAKADNKMLVKLTSGEIFSASLAKGQNKLECLSLASFYNQEKYF